MPRIHTLQGGVSQGPIPTARRRESVETGLGSVAAGAEALSDVMHKERMQAAHDAEMVERTAADTALSQWENAALYDPENGALNRRGENAFDLPGQVLPALDEEAKRIRATLRSPRSQMAFDSAYGARRAAVEQGLNRHESRERSAFYDSTDTEAIAQAAQDAALHGDDASADEAERKQRAIIQRQAKRNGWSLEQIAAAERAATTDLHTGVIAARLQRKDYAGAKAYFDRVSDALSVDARLKVQGVMQDAAGQATADTILASYAQNTFRGDKALQALVADTSLSTEEKNDIRRRVASGLELHRSEVRRQLVSQIAGLEQDLASGSTAPNLERRALSLYEKGALTPDGYAAYLSAAANNRERMAKANADILLAQQAYANSTPLYPKDEHAKKGMDALFQAATAGQQPGTNGYVATAIEMARRTNIVPQSFVDWAGALVTQAPTEGGVSAEQVSNAVSALGAMRDSAPQATRYIEDAKLWSFVDQVDSAVRAGAPQQAAIEAARKLTFDMTDQQIKTLEEAYRRQDYADNNASELESLLDSDDRYDRSIGFGGAPSAPFGMQADFEEATSRYFRFTGGNIDRARELAYRDIGRKWGYSRVNGNAELMPWAPEALYPQLKVEDIRKDLEESYATVASQVRALDPNTGEVKPASVKPADLVLIPGQVTARTDGIMWDVGFVNEYGDLDVLRDENNQPVRYQLRASPEELKAARAEEERKNLEAARKTTETQRAYVKAVEDLARSDPGLRTPLSAGGGLVVPELRSLAPKPNPNIRVQ